MANPRRAEPLSVEAGIDNDDAQDGKASGVVVDEAHRAAQWQKQIDYGKNTLAYQAYIKHIPKHMRKREHPDTPEITKDMSKKRFDGQVRAWRRMLHKFDDLAQQELQGPTQGDKSTALAASPSAGKKRDASGAVKQGSSRAHDTEEAAPRNKGTKDTQLDRSRSREGAGSGAQHDGGRGQSRGRSSGRPGDKGISGGRDRSGGEGCRGREGGHSQAGSRDGERRVSQRSGGSQERSKGGQGPRRGSGDTGKGQPGSAARGNAAALAKASPLKPGAAARGMSWADEVEDDEAQRGGCKGQASKQPQSRWEQMQEDSRDAWDLDIQL